MAYLQITLDISEKNRAAAAAVYQKYKAPFLSQRSTALFQKNCWYVPKMCRFCIVSTRLNRLKPYLGSQLFTADVVEALKPYLNRAPDVRIYDVA